MKRSASIYQPFIEHSYTAWELAIYGTGNEYSGLSPYIATRISECCKLFHQISCSSDRARVYWQAHVVQLFDLYKDEFENKPNIIWRNLFFSYSQKMNDIAIEIDVLICDNADLNQSEVINLLKPLKAHGRNPNGDKHIQYHLFQYFQSERDKSFEFLRLSADQGLGVAQYRLAKAYAHGYYGAKKDPKEAFKYYKLVADQWINEFGDSDYHLERGVNKRINLEKAAVHYMGVVDRKEIINEKMLFAAAYCYEKGIGTSVNFKIALKYYKQIASYVKYIDLDRCLNNQISMIKVASCYERGFGTTKNIPEAIRYYKLVTDPRVVKLTI